MILVEEIIEQILKVRRESIEVLFGRLINVCIGG